MLKKYQFDRTAGKRICNMIQDNSSIQKATTKYRATSTTYHQYQLLTRVEVERTGKTVILLAEEWLVCVLFVALMFKSVAEKFEVATIIGVSLSILAIVEFCVTAVNLPLVVVTVGRLVLPTLFTNFMYCTCHIE